MGAYKEQPCLGETCPNYKVSQSCVFKCMSSVIITATTFDSDGKPLLNTARTLCNYTAEDFETLGNVEDVLGRVVSVSFEDIEQSGT